jgi:hypothetical protein
VYRTLKHPVQKGCKNPVSTVRADNNSFERVEDLKYLGKTLTNQNFVQEEIKSRLKSGNALLSFGS